MDRKAILLFVVLLTPLAAFGVLSSAAEKVTLSVPLRPDTRQAVDLSVERLVFDFKGQGLIITLGDGTVSKEYAYNGAPALAKMKALNKANHSLPNKSLQRQIIETIQADFPETAGTVTGAPD